MAHATYHLAAGRPANVCYASDRYRNGEPLKATRRASDWHRSKQHRYSISSSAVTRSAWTGSSLGFSPFRMRSA